MLVGAAVGVGASVCAGEAVRGDGVATGTTADARGLGAPVAADPDDDAGLEVAGALGLTVVLGAVGTRGGKSMARPSRASLLRLNAPRATATAIDGPSNT